EQHKPDVLQHAYGTLECNINDPFDMVKKQYRKLIREYHPDKLHAKGLPEELLRFATEKAQKLNEAYDIIKQSEAKS
ncbi:MAG: DnaJ domain-containing protein, partial [Ghiorsea sp.]|nr:DnaJ domain-containing protein [Ghiorsea sp.]